jgi:glucose-6-phosphate-specific signal transduction histidine kinase
MTDSKQKTVQYNCIDNSKNRQFSRLNSLYQYERKCWAEQLHDDFGQSLAAIKSFSENIKNKLDQPQDIMELTNIIETTANDLYISCYDLMQGLRSGLNIEGNLEDNLQACILNSRTDKQGVNTCLITKNTPQSSSNIINMFITRVFQDSLSTILRADCACEIHICITHNIENIQLTMLIQTVKNSILNINCEQFEKIKRYAKAFSCNYSLELQTNNIVNITLCTDITDFIEDF